MPVICYFLVYVAKMHFNLSKKKPLKLLYHNHHEISYYCCNLPEITTEYFLTFHILFHQLIAHLDSKVSQIKV